PTVTTDVATTATATSSSAFSSAAPEADIDPSQPTLQLQIRLADGTRLQSRFNTSQTVGHVRAFVNAARPATRPWTLMTTFPTKELKDEAQVLGEMAEFKRGGVVVQKWV
ncbi:protein phosphatase regulator, partial [Cryomyces antarcticus]